ncbi:MAG: adenylate/guanylate cyclase domain-containing protein, partial [bacterium]|nr:adenylate/guanylate cyclase domain-containing protein [bacterium]
NYMVDGLRERDRIKDTFQRYVTRQVADEILSGREQVHLSGEKREVTILFSDIRGFTSMSETLRPEQVVSLLNEYLSLMIDVIFKYEGTLDKFIGDGIMALFGAPIVHDNDPERAVRTALEMQRKMSELNNRRTSRREQAIYIGIGINTGEVVAGNIGSSKRMEYTVIGDHVNVAARIESQTTGGQVLISENTYHKIRDKFSIRELPPTRVKGKEIPIKMYEVLGNLGRPQGPVR